MDDSTQYLNDGFSNSKSLFNITSMTYLNPRDIDGIKLAIKEYGAVTTGISTYCPQNKYVDSNGDINFYSDSNPPALNHAVMLVGWDDKYSKNNFSPTLLIKSPLMVRGLLKTPMRMKNIFGYHIRTVF